MVAGGKRLVRQVVQFKKTYTRNVCHYIILNFMCWGIERRSICFGGGGGGGIEKRLCVLGVIKMRLE